IPLRDIVSVSRSNTKTYCIEIRTNDRSYYVQCKNDDDLYTWLDTIYDHCPLLNDITSPRNFRHETHVDFDPQTGMFVGLPESWERLLQQSHLTKEDYAQNPQAVLDVLDFYTKNTAEGRAAVAMGSDIGPFNKMAGLISSNSRPGLAQNPRADYLGGSLQGYGGGMVGGYGAATKTEELPRAKRDENGRFEPPKAKQPPVVAPPPTNVKLPTIKPAAVAEAQRRDEYHAKNTAGSASSTSATLIGSGSAGVKSSRISSSKSNSSNGET
ncbi:Protein kinase, partial [Spiromyces aspiralis]